MERGDQPGKACLLGCLHDSTVRSRPHLEHLLDVILVLGVYDTIHVPLEDFDQVPGEDTVSSQLQNRQHGQSSLFLWRIGKITNQLKLIKNTWECSEKEPTELQAD